MKVIVDPISKVLALPTAPQLAVANGFPIITSSNSFTAKQSIIINGGDASYSSPQAFAIGLSSVSTGSDLAGLHELSWTPQIGDTNLDHCAFMGAAFAYGPNNGNSLTGVRGVASSRGSGVIENISCFISHGGSQTTGGGSVTNYFNFNAGTPDAGASLLTNSYAFYINQQSGTGVSNGYGIWQASSTDRNFFAGLSQFFGSLYVNGGTFQCSSGNFQVDGSGNLQITGGALATVSNAGVGTSIRSGSMDYSFGSNLHFYTGLNGDDKFHIRCFNSGSAFVDLLSIDLAGNTSILAGVFSPLQASSAPSYVKGALYYDTTSNKLMVGGSTSWETVTSI